MNTGLSSKRLLPHTLASRLATVYSLTFVVMLGLAFMLLYASIQALFDYRLDNDLAEDVQWLTRAMARDGDEAGIREIRREGESDDTDELFVILGDATGQVLYSTSLDTWPGARIDPAVATRVLDNGELLFQTENFTGRESAARTVVAPVGENRIAYLAESLEERDEVMELLLSAFAMVFLFAVPVASALVWYLSRNAVKGIETISDTARAIRNGELDRRAPVETGVAEVDLLAQSFNAMAERNQTLIDDMRDMTDNIAHDLRSPLTRVRIVAEASLHDSSSSTEHTEAANEIIQECDRLTRMISVALDVSEAEAGVSRSTHIPVDLGELLIDVVELFEPVGEEQNINIRCSVDDSLTVKGERTALERLFVNLVDNAIKYTPPYGSIRIQARREGTKLKIDVVDSGAGIPSDVLTRVFDRYFRGDSSRTSSGSGLGLSYARAVARLHGGDIQVSSEFGIGTRFTVELPAMCRVERPAMFKLLKPALSTRS